MTPGLRAFLNGLIDYAGLFPPARLPLEPAIRNFARYRAEPDGWMLGRFVCPTTRLPELDAYVGELFALGSSWPVAALGRGGNDLVEWQTNLRADVDTIGTFHKQHAGRVNVDVVEIRFPPSISDPSGHKALTSILKDASKTLAALEASPSPFYEVLNPTQASATAVIGSLAEHNSGGTPGVHQTRPAGFKLRTGGETPPPAQLVAAVIDACRNRGVPFKATAGLHHPFPVPGSPERLHGFVNVFGAAILAHACALRPEELTQVVADSQPANFEFGPDGMRWRDRGVTTADMDRARRALATSFGSCSFDEPREDMKTLGWLP